MIKFNFEVSDEDAENIFGCIDDCICNCDFTIVKLLTRQSGRENEKNTEEIQWCRNRKEYLKELIFKMKNSKI